MDDASQMDDWIKAAQAYVDDPKNAAMFESIVHRLQAA
jgi:flagellar hook-associated protein FlgK